MKENGISQNIKLLTTVLLGAIALGAVVSLLAMLQLRSTVEEYKSTTDDTRLATYALEDVLEARLASVKYRLDPTDANAEDVRGNVAEVFEALEQLAARMAEGDEELQDVEAVRTGIASYAESFARLTQVQRRWEEVSPVLSRTGTAAREKLTSVIEGSGASGDAAELYVGAIAQQSLLLARVYSERFLVTNAEGDLERALAEIESAEGLVGRLVTTVQEPSLRAFSESAEGDLVAFRGALEDMSAIVSARNAERASLDAAGPVVLTAIEDLLDTISAHQESIREASGVTIAWTLGIIVTITGLSFAGAVFASIGIRRAIESQLDASLATMTELADGNLEVSIENADMDTEMGRIARALVRFRDKGLEARRLAAEARAQEETQKTREAEEMERRREDERRAAERVEEERRKTLAELSASIGKVVRAAVDGDFSQRIDDEFTDPELREMVSMINRMAENVEKGVNETASVIAGLATGDLTLSMSGHHRGKFGELAASVNEMSEKLSRLVDRIAEQCHDVAHAAQSMSGQSDDLQARVEQQAASLEETAAAMEQISATVRSSAETSSLASQHAGMTAEKAAEAGNVVESAVAAMGEISEASSKIEDIVTVIDGISFQTSLLALNAGVEAARAGESGRGFAVVASEVRALALRSSEASKDIQNLIALSSERIEKGVQLVEATGRTLVEVVDEVEEMSAKLDGLKATTTEQSQGVSEVTSAMNQLDGITQENARLADQGNSTSRDVASQAQEMLRLLASFKTHGGSSVAAAVAV